ncbi:MAG: UPF0158 family protein [Myxococcota bacterium]
MDRREVAVDAASLIAALTARDEGLVGTYLDLREGELLRLFDPAVVGRDNEPVERRIDADPDRYAKIPLYSREYRLMTEFVDTVEDDDLAHRLDAALAGGSAFRSFDAVLAGWPAERVRWGQYREAALVRWATAWLRSLDVEPRWVGARWADPAATGAAEVPYLLQIALRGAPGDQDDAMVRTLRCSSEQQAQATFLRLARELCDLAAEPFRVRAWRGRSRITRGAVEIRRDGTTVTLSLRR